VEGVEMKDVGSGWSRQNCQLHTWYLSSLDHRRTTTSHVWLCRWCFDVDEGQPSATEPQYNRGALIFIVTPLAPDTDRFCPRGYMWCSASQCRSQLGRVHQFRRHPARTRDSDSTCLFRSTATNTQSTTLSAARCSSDAGACPCH